MARTSVTPVQPTSVFQEISANEADVSLTALTGSSGDDGNQFTASGNDLVLVHNSDGANPYTVTFTSVEDPYGREGDITTYSLAAGEYALFGPFKNTGWRQADGKIYIEGSNAAIKVLVIQI